MTLYDKYLQKLADKDLMKPFGNKVKDKKDKKTISSTEYSSTPQIDPKPLSESVK